MQPGEGNRSFTSLLGFLRSAIETFPEVRTGNNTRYSIEDIALSAFSVFFTQSPSFLAYQTSMQQNKGNNNARTLFGIEKIPCDNQIRALLDPVPAAHLFSVFDRTVMMMNEAEQLDGFRSFDNQLLVALDGTGYFSSNTIHCEYCLTKEHADGSITYQHTALLPAVVAPGRADVIPLAPEFIRKQDGKKKQDCENVAAKRWLDREGEKYRELRVTVLGDDLYCNQPMIERILDKGLGFILTCKPKSHPWLTEWVTVADPEEDLHQFSLTRWTGKERLTDTYQYVNGIPIRDGKNALLVNWVQLRTTNEEGEILYRNAFATNHEITAENVQELVEAGRTRWKIENENNNTLKTKGYHFEHNFGHGRRHLSETLLTLNLLGFLFHTVLEIFDQRYRLIRQTLPRRKDFFNDIRALTRYICFESWEQLLAFMIRGLELPDPGG